MKNLFVILIMFCGFLTYSQEYEITGFAPDFVGDKVTLYTYQDYITMTKLKLGEAKVDPKDSVFHLPLKTSSTIKGILEIGNVESNLYLAPETNYELYFPKPENQAVSFQNQKTEVYFYGLDSTDINYRILQYNRWFDSFVAYHEKDIAGGQFLAYLDTFKVYAAEAYKDVKDEYFITYVRYNIGEMQQTYGGNSRSDKRLQTYLNYIQPFPVYYENDQYMKFFKGFYGRDFDDFPPKIEAYVNVAIDKASPTRLMSALKKDIFLSRPEIREMVMIDKLGKRFYENYNDKGRILIILDSVAQHASYKVNATIAKNVKEYLTNLEEGYPAPAINLTNPNDSTDMLQWGDYRGQFVYLNFFETWNDQAMADMRIIAELKKKYGMFVSFLSLCTDKDQKGYQKMLDENPEFDWDIVYIGNDHQLKKNYEVKVVPSYLLIDPSGFIAMAPAPTPSPDGEYESIDKTFFFIKKSMTP